MIAIFFLVVAVGAVAASWLLVQSQVALVRRGEVSVEQPLPLGELIRSTIDWIYFHCSLAVKQSIHYGYYYFLVTLRRLLVIIRFLLVRVERRCARLIDSVRGRGVLHKRGAVSLFLSEIKEHKDSAALPSAQE